MVDFQASRAYFWDPESHRIWRKMHEALQVAGLTLMIRATRGRSRRPNHMPSHFRSPKAMTPVNLRRGPGDFHSVAKQAWLCVALRSDFGGFGRARRVPKFDFRASFFDVIFGCVFVSTFGRFLEPQNQKNINFPKEK